MILGQLEILGSKKWIPGHNYTYVLSEDMLEFFFCMHLHAKNEEQFYFQLKLIKAFVKDACENNNFDEQFHSGQHLFASH